MKNPWRSPSPEGWEEIAWDALAEDIGSGDPSGGIFAPDHSISWFIETEAQGVVCGVGVADFLLTSEGDDSWVEVLAQDGEEVKPRTKILQGETPASHLLSRERTSLNFLMQLSGVATLTHRFVESVKGLECDILDTRKTVPGLRILQKYAVRCGGGRNHRFGLYDGIMLKDNHILTAGSITKAVKMVRVFANHMVKVEVECTNLEMVGEAVACGADIVMLDNFKIDQMVKAVKMYRDKTVLEASGGVNLETVREIAETGVHAISVGVLTHSAPSLSLHLEVK